MGAYWGPNPQVYPETRQGWLDERKKVGDEQGRTMRESSCGARGAVSGHSTTFHFSVASGESLEWRSVMFCFKMQTSITSTTPAGNVNQGACDRNFSVVL